MPAKHKKWNNKYLIEAITACRKKRMGYVKSAQPFKLPRSMVYIYVDIGNKNNILKNFSGVTKKQIFD